MCKFEVTIVDIEMEKSHNRLVSRTRRSRCVFISWYTISKHSDCGMEGNKLVTSIETRMASSGMCRSSSILISEVELCK